MGGGLQHGPATCRTMSSRPLQHTAHFIRLAGSAPQRMPKHPLACERGCMRRSGRGTEACGRVPVQAHGRGRTGGRAPKAGNIRGGPARPRRNRRATSVRQLRHGRREEGPTEPHAGRSTFLLSSGGVGGGYY